MRKLFYFILLFSLSFHSISQDPGFDNFSILQGLSQSQVYAIAQDHRGFLWLGTQGGGLCKFNGEDFQTYTTTDGLSDNYVNCLKYSSDSILWIGTEKGLCYFDGSKFQTLRAVGSSAISDLEIDRDGVLWVGTSSGLFSIKGDELGTPEDYNLLEPVYAIAPFGGKVTVAIENRFIEISLDGPLHKHSMIPGLSEIANDLMYDQNGKLWAGGYRHGLSVWNDTTWTHPLEEHGNPIVLSMVPDQNGLWLGTLSKGIFQLAKGEISNITTANGLPDNQVRCMLMDSWSDLWIGTSGGGLSRYLGQQITHISRENGLPARQVYSVCGDEKNQLWMGVGDEGLYRYNLSTGEIFSDPLVKQVKVKCLFKDRKKRIWAGTQGRGIYLFESDSTLHISGESGLSGSWVKDITESPEGVFWIATAGGGITKLTEHSDGFYSDIINRYNGLPDDRINTVKADSLGRIWYGSESGGLGVVLPDETVLSFESERPETGKNIRSISIDRFKRLWIGSGDAGLSYIDLNESEMTVKKLPQELQPQLLNVYSVCSDSFGNTWVGTANGVQLYSRKSETEIQRVHISEKDGFRGVESCTNSYYFDDEGYLWLGTMNGVNRISTGFQPSSTRIPQASIAQISLFYRPLEQTNLSYFVGKWGELKDTLVLTYEQNHLNFDLNGVSLSQPDEVSFQWWMEGYDSTWTPLLSRSNATFSNLQPGTYTFWYRACLSPDNCSPEKLLHIQVLSPIWQKNNFLVGAFIFIFLFVFILFWLIFRAYQLRNRRKRESLVMQNRILELEQQALRLQMNPHFIFNTLNSIQGLIAIKDSKTARKQLSDFSSLIRSILENAREELIPLSEELNACSRYASLERTARGLDFSLEINATPNEDPWIPPLILQPFVENAIVHGLVPLEAGGRISINCVMDDEDLLISIEDNGVGRNTQKKQAKNHKSLGISVTQERLSQGMRSGEIEIEDLFDSAGRPSGTRVELRIFEAHN